MPDPTDTAEGRRHGHKECHDEIARVRAENERLRALLAAAGVDAGEGGTT